MTLIFLYLISSAVICHLLWHPTDRLIEQAKTDEQAFRVLQSINPKIEARHLNAFQRFTYWFALIIGLTWPLGIVLAMAAVARRAVRARAGR